MLNFQQQKNHKAYKKSEKYNPSKEQIDRNHHWKSTDIGLARQKLQNNCIKYAQKGFPGGAVVESLPANAGDMGSSPGLGRSHMPRSN